MMTNNPIEILETQLSNLQKELENTLDVKKQLEIKKEIENNKKILQDKYNHVAKATKGMTLGQLESKVNAMGNPIIRATGIKLLDDFFGGGFEEETFINLVGESGAGKSTLGIEILLNIAEYHKSVFFSLEMGIKRTKKKLFKFNPTDNQKQNLIIDLDTHNLDDIKTEITIYSQRDGIKFFLIDSKMKLRADGFKDEYRMISHISNELSKLTQKLGVIIIMINQISEENLKNGRVSLKGSGDQIYDSDVIMVYKKVKDNDKIRHLEVFKNRTGEEQKGTIETTIQGNKTISTKEIVEVTEFGSDNDYLKDFL